MSERRLDKHPILRIPEDEPCLPLYWNGERLLARPGETIAAALIAAGHDTFGHHPRDGAPLGLFCANGQCGQCTVVANGVAVKACMVPVSADLVVQSCDRLPALPVVTDAPIIGETRVLRTQALIIGAGPAGLAAAQELGALGVEVLVVDDKAEVGGKLVLQTHRFFGSTEDTRAGTRGIEIARELANEVAAFESVRVWLRATAVGVFSDGRVGVVTNHDGHYHLIEPETLLIATGARERQLPFANHTLPGIYGAGAFQTLLNRDLVRPCARLLVLGAGNVGLIAAYHALQVDIEVVGVVEVMPRVGGYQVHADKLRHLGVPLYLSHAVIAAHGEDHVRAVTIAQVDETFQVVPGTDKTFEVDALLVAVGLAPLDELYHQALAYGMRVYVAGDARAIAEASSAIFGGRIAARDMARDMGIEVQPVPEEWHAKRAALAARAGAMRSLPEVPEGLAVYPILRCTQEIPCNPCVAACPKHAIEKQGDPLRGRPALTGPVCTGCARCLVACPGLAITLVDTRKDPEQPIVVVAFEQPRDKVAPGTLVLATDARGVPLGRFEVVRVRDAKSQDHTLLVHIRATRATAPLIAGIRVQDPEDLRPVDPVPQAHTGAPVVDDGPPAPAGVPDDVIVCRCERVTAGQVREAIRAGIRDINELKGQLRVCMGACCGKNCPEHILRLYREAGVELEQVTPPSKRPLFVEVPFGVFAAGSGDS